MPPEAVPSNASVASTGLGLRYIGEHCAAWSGLIQINTTLTECLNFTSGSGYIVCDLTLCGAAKHDGGTNTGANTVYEIYFNGVRFLLIKVESIQEDMPAMETIPLLIPPFTQVKIAFRCDVSTANLFNSVALAGRVYGAD